MSLKKIRRKWLLVFFLFACLFFVSLAFAGRVPKIFCFDRRDALREWKEKIFTGRVMYSVKIESADGYLNAFSKNSASGIFYEIRFDPKKQPLISWKWKVVKFPAKKEGSITTARGWLERDDYAARFYVIFPGFFFPFTKSLEYVWDKSLPEGKVISSPYCRNIKIIVVESGEENSGNWVLEERNIYEDFKKAFGQRPPKVGAIAIMTDADNTLSSAEADYDEIKVGGRYGGD